MSDNDVKLGYIGLGKRALRWPSGWSEWPGGLTVYDVRVEAMTPLAEPARTLADSVADVAKADIISVTVLNDEQVRDVVAANGLAAHAKPGTVIAIHSTIEPNTAGRTGRAAARRMEFTSSMLRSAAVPARPTRVNWPSWSALTTRPSKGQAGVQAVGLAGGPRRRTRCGHADEAGPQHADIHRVRRRMRGARSWPRRRASTCRSSGEWCDTVTSRAVARARSCTATTRNR